jgi:enamine deaminase RidA (YjgF/YER057c/UK114 family)
MIQAPGDIDFSEQLRFIEDRYRAAQREMGLGPESAILRRFFLSDILNQAAAVRQSVLACETPDNPVATTLLQQTPLPESKIAMLAYHIESPIPLKKVRLSPRHLLIEKNGNRHLWSMGLCADSYDSSHSPAEQTKNGFDDATLMLTSRGASLRDHGVRTWIYCKDVDVFYAGMVDSRRALFAQQEMNGDTHYIASTAIEGGPAHKNGLVAIDIYSQLDLAPGQVTYLYDSNYLPARNHQVAFEYGTKIDYRDRAHLFPSGTGSVDPSLKILHVGDVMRQLDRALENIEALLRAGKAGLQDLTHMIVYLRDPTDYKRVARCLDERFAELPKIIVQAPVCNPDWLVEIETSAIIANKPDLGGKLYPSF